MRLIGETVSGSADEYTRRRGVSTNRSRVAGLDHAVGPISYFLAMAWASTDAGPGAETKTASR